MGDAGALRLLGFRALYVAALLAIVLVLMLPIRIEAGRLPGPDLILALTIAWAVRRPDHLPILTVAGAALAVDLLLMRPPGLMAALTVIAVVPRALADPVATSGSGAGVPPGPPLSMEHAPSISDRSSNLKRPIRFMVPDITAV